MGSKSLLKITHYEALDNHMDNFIARQVGAYYRKWCLFPLCEPIDGFQISSFSLDFYLSICRYFDHHCSVYRSCVYCQGNREKLTKSDNHTPITRKWCLYGAVHG